MSSWNFHHLLGLYLGREASQPPKKEGGQDFDINAKPYRKDSYLFTDEEWNAIEDVKFDLRRKHEMPITKNDIARAAMHQLIEDFRKTGDASIVVRRLRKKHPK
jgi:hypothetical protein